MGNIIFQNVSIMLERIINIKPSIIRFNVIPVLKRRNIPSLAIINGSNVHGF